MGAAALGPGRRVPREQAAAGNPWPLPRHLTPPRPSRYAGRMAPNLILHAGQGDIAPRTSSRRDLALERRAFREGWPITPEVRQQVVDEALNILQTARSPARRLAAARVLIAADTVNVRREANAVMERNGERSALTDVLGATYRAALENAETRELLIRLDEALAHTTAAKALASHDLPVTGQIQPKVDRASQGQSGDTHPNGPCGKAECWCSRVTGWDAGEGEPNTQ
jgi:hypothetical protein